MPAFTDKVVFLTGASSGIGAAVARELSRQGASLALMARRVDRVEALAQEVNSGGGKALALKADVTRDGDLEAATRATVERFGRIDVVIANAGFGVAGAVARLKLEDFQRQFDTNVWGMLRTFWATIEELKKTRGTLVLVGSVSSYVTSPNVAPYSMSKFAVRSLAEALDAELARFGVSVVLICPGFIQSEIRQIDNQGQLHPDAKDTVPPWLVVPTATAARDIVRAIRCRRRETIITFHGKVIVFVKRFFPCLLAWGMKRGSMKKRREPGKKAAD